MSRILSLVRSERSVTLLMLLRAAYSSEGGCCFVGRCIRLVTCEIDQEVGPKKFSEATGTDRENLEGGHLFTKHSAIWISIRN